MKTTIQPFSHYNANPLKAVTQHQPLHDAKVVIPFTIIPIENKPVKDTIANDPVNWDAEWFSNYE